MAQDALPSGAIIVPVGSRVTCNPPPMDTDEDYLVLVKDKEAAIAGLKSLGFEFSKDPKTLKEYERMNNTAQWEFTSLFFGNVNYIVTTSEFFFERFLTATHICKALNLLNKADRVMVFEAVRGGSFSKEVSPEWKPDWGKFFKHSKSGSEINDKLTAHLAGNVKFANMLDAAKPLPF